MSPASPTLVNVVAKRRIPRGDDPVAGRGQRGARPVGRPFHRGEHRFGALQIARMTRCANRTRSMARAARHTVHGGDVPAGAERRPGSGDHDRADRAVGVCGLDSLCERDAHSMSIGVTFVRPVERDGPHRSVGLR